MRGNAKRDGLRGDCYKIRIVFNRQRDSFEKFPPFFRHKKAALRIFIQEGCQCAMHQASCCFSRKIARKIRRTSGPQ